MSTVPRAPVDPSIIDALRHIPTPAVANAIELFDVRPRSEGFMTPDIRCILPDQGVMVGFAATARIAALQPADETPSADRASYWEHVLRTPGPTVAVVQDIDNPAGVGAFWGEVNANVHKALGCVGTVTNGGVRDLDEVAELGFHFFASEAVVSHAYVHIVDFGKPVRVGGLTIRPGDLIHADKHGVLTIPIEIAGEIPEAVRRIEEKEREIIRLCQSDQFSIEALKRLYG